MIAVDGAGGNGSAGWRGIREAGSTPLLILSALNFVDEFDRFAFLTLAPEIRTSFGLTNSGFILLTSTALGTAILLSIPLGFAGDKRRRTRLAFLAALGWLVGSLTTALTSSLLILGMARMLAGSGRMGNEVIHPSLISDYYRPTAQPLAHALHRTGNHIGALAGAPLAGFLASYLNDWRPAFVIMSVPTLFVLMFVWLLQEPPRTQRPQISIGQAVGLIFRTRSLFRLWLPGAMFGASFLPLTAVMSLLLDADHGVGPAGRGFAQALFSVAGMAGLFLNARLSREALSRETPGVLMKIASALTAAFALGMLVFALSPWLWLATVGIVLAGIGSFGVMPSVLTAVAQATPAVIRTRAYAFIGLVFGVGVLLGGGMAGALSRSGNLSLPLAGLAALAAIGGISLMRTSRYMDADALRASIPQPEAAASIT